VEYELYSIAIDRQQSLYLALIFYTSLSKCVLIYKTCSAIFWEIIKDRKPVYDQYIICLYAIRKKRHPESIILYIIKNMQLNICLYFVNISRTFGNNYEHLPLLQNLMECRKCNQNIVWILLMLDARLYICSQLRNKVNWFNVYTCFFR
jgi:hypothetical protein